MDASIREVPHWNRLSLDEDDPEFNAQFFNTVNDRDVPDTDEEEVIEVYDQYVNMELALPQGHDGECLHTTVKRRALDHDGKPMGNVSNNPILDTRLYEVKFVNGAKEVLAANVIAENILSQVDKEGHRQILLDEIIDHRKNDNVISMDDVFFTTRRGLRRRKYTTRGWDICVYWKDRSLIWTALKDLKNSYPVQLAEYAVANRIQDEPAFAW